MVLLLACLILLAGYAILAGIVMLLGWLLVPLLLGTLIAVFLATMDKVAIRLPKVGKVIWEQNWYGFHPPLVTDRYKRLVEPTVHRWIHATLTSYCLVANRTKKPASSPIHERSVKETNSVKESARLG